MAILTVCALHWIGTRSSQFQGGYIGVDVFFVLSGFIITLLLIRGRPTYPDFIRGRIRRLYPPLLGLLVFGTLLVWVWPQGALQMDQTVRNALISATQLSSVWQAIDDTLQPPFGVSWSLAIEWYFYLLWPFLVYRLRDLPARRAAAISLGLAAVLYVGSLPMSDSFFYFGPTARFAALLVGASLAFLISDNPQPDPWPGQRALSALAMLFIVAWTVVGPVNYDAAYRMVGLPLTIASASILIIAGYADPRSPMVRILSWKPLTTVGLVSYSLYLWHTFPIFLLKNGWMGLPTPVIGLLGVSLALLLTVVAYMTLERPFSRSRSRQVPVSRSVGREPDGGVSSEVRP